MCWCSKCVTVVIFIAKHLVEHLRVKVCPENDPDIFYSLRQYGVCTCVQTVFIIYLSRVIPNGRMFERMRRIPAVYDASIWTPLYILPSGPTFWTKTDPQT